MGWNRRDWQESSPEQLDLYALLGRPRFDSDRLGLLADIKSANRELHDYQNHTSKQIAARAREWQLALAKARKTLESPDALRELHQELLGQLVERAQTKGLPFDTAGITRWLSAEERIHSQAIPWVAQSILTGDDGAFFQPWDAATAGTWPKSVAGTSAEPAASHATPTSLFPTSTDAPLYDGASAAKLPPPLPTAALLPQQLAAATELPVATPVVATQVTDEADYRLSPEISAPKNPANFGQLNRPLAVARPEPQRTIEIDTHPKEAAAFSQTQLILLITGGGIATAISMGILVLAIGMMRPSPKNAAANANNPQRPSDNLPTPKLKTENVSTPPQRALPPPALDQTPPPAPSPPLPASVPPPSNIVPTAVFPTSATFASGGPFGLPVSQSFARYGNAVRVTAGLKPTWSPGAKYLAFAYPPGKGPKGKGGIGVVDMATGKEAPWLIEGRHPAWSPDGRRIAYVRGPGLSPTPSDAVWLFDLQTQTDQLVGSGQLPHWRNNDSRLLFWSPDQAAMLQANVQSFPIVPEAWSAAPRGAEAGLSPDGQQVAISTLVADKGWSVIVHRLSGGPPSLLLFGRAGGVPAFDPRGPRIVVGGRQGSSTGLWLSEAITGSEFQVAEGPITSAAWSPDGKWLAFDYQQPSGADHEIWMLEAATLNAAQPAFKRPPSDWNPSPLASNTSPPPSQPSPLAPPSTFNPAPTVPSGNSPGTSSTKSPSTSPSSSKRPTIPPDLQSKLSDSDRANSELQRSSTPFGTSKNIIARFKSLDSSATPPQLVVRFTGYSERRFDAPAGKEIAAFFAGLIEDDVIEFACRKVPGNNYQTRLQLTSIQRYQQPETAVEIKNAGPAILATSLHSIDSRVDDALRAEWSEKGRWLAVGDAGREGAVVDGQTGTITIKLDTGIFAWAPMESGLASVKSGTLVVWDLATMQEITLGRPTGKAAPTAPALMKAMASITGLYWQPASATLDKHRLVVESAGQLNVFDVEWKRKRLQPANLVLGPGMRLQFSPDGKQVAMLRTPSMLLWQPTVLTKALPKTTSRFQSIAELAWRENTLGVTHMVNGRWEISFVKLAELRTDDARGGSQPGIAIDAIAKSDWSPDGSRFACYDPRTGSGGSIRLWETGPISEERPLLEGGNIDGAMRFAPNNRVLAVARTYPSRIEIWDVVDRVQKLMVIPKDNNNIQLLRWSPDGGRLASVDNRGRVTIWDVPDGQNGPR